MSWRAAFRRLFGPQASLVGRDLKGNEYFESVKLMEGAGEGGQMQRPKRYMVPPRKAKLHDYDEDTIPTEWQRWMRHLRNDPPSIEELQLTRHKAVAVQRRAKELDAQWKTIREESLKRTTYTQSQGHASAPSTLDAAAPVVADDDDDDRRDPRSDAKTFQPGSWRPNQ
ncbi:NADH dehydrogenase [ubiquinone] 1 alpha subcomplex assembly factor 2-like [Oscarella lobularis]|uniref:NADH dehydrogenase [ubiquinone] 1 alpha subcomplex assembly factor 2-like n=1 Tax=Oscarella lobularis TaxID=121494 RepID=UPI0033135724